MSNQKEPLSVTRQYTIQYVGNGTAWLIYSISNLIPFISFQLISSVFLMISSVGVLYTLFVKKEPKDEMSIRHIQDAKSLSLDLILCSLVIVGIISSFYSFSFYKAFGFFVAASQILSGLLFLINEKEGL